VRARELGAESRAPEMVDRPAGELIGGVAVGHERASACLDAEDPSVSHARAISASSASASLAARAGPQRAAASTGSLSAQFDMFNSAG